MIQIKNRFLILIAIIGFNNVIRMDEPKDEVVAAEGDGMIIVGDNHYEEDNLLDPDKTKMTELRKVIEKNKTEIIAHSSLFSLLLGGVFNTLFLPNIAEDENWKFLNFIKKNPKISTAIVATGGGIIAGGSTVLHYVGEREKKREQLQNIKDLEKDNEEIINNPLLDDITKNIQMENMQKLLNKAIQKYNKGN